MNAEAPNLWIMFLAFLGALALLALVGGVLWIVLVNGLDNRDVRRKAG